ncbi:MAG: CarD family transcriptional regulator [Sandaracinaceae bacterium]|nr:CarD family transcriptional regulator [Sandaracinaceae bacterium]
MPRELEFKVGDKSVHPHHGVGEVTAIEHREIAGQRKAFYTLHLMTEGTKVMVATDAAAKLGLRRPVSRRESTKVLDILRDKTIAVTSQPWNRRYREYMEMLNSGSPYEVAKVLRDLSVIRGEKELSFGERGLLDKARNLLVGELAIARRCKEERMQTEIEAILGLGA